MTKRKKGSDRQEIFESNPRILLTGAFQVSLDFKIVVSFVFNARVHSCTGVALVLATLVVVGVVTVAVLANVLTGLFLGVHLHLSVGIDELVHADNILSLSLATGSARFAAGAQSKLDHVHGVQIGFAISILVLVVASSIAFITDLKKRRATHVLDGVSRHPRVVIIVVIRQGTSLAQESLSSSRVSWDIRLGDHGRGRSGEKEDGSGLDEHGRS